MFQGFKEQSIIHIAEDGYDTVFHGIKTKERPAQFAYAGDISLLKDVSKNIAVIGVLTPTKDIVEREQAIVISLSKRGFHIVSGLANGCDAVAHKTAIECNGKTIAFLPSTLANIYPKQNIELAEQIVESGGLVLTEYIMEPQSRYERISRFIARDRLQAMFSRAVILIASYVKGMGDSGSRHAMQKAKEYGRQRYCMYHEEADSDREIFSLNKLLVKEGVPVLTWNLLAHL